VAAESACLGPVWKPLMSPTYLTNFVGQTRDWTETRNRVKIGHGLCRRLGREMANPVKKVGCLTMEGVW